MANPVTTFTPTEVAQIGAAAGAGQYLASQGISISDWGGVYNPPPVREQGPVAAIPVSPGQVSTGIPTQLQGLTWGAVPSMQENLPVSPHSPAVATPIISSNEVVVGSSPSTNEVLVKNTLTGEMYWAPGTKEQISSISEAIKVQQPFPGELTVLTGGGTPTIPTIPTAVGAQLWEKAASGISSSKEAETSYLSELEAFSSKWDKYYDPATGKYDLDKYVAPTVEAKALQGVASTFNEKWGKYYVPEENSYILESQEQVEEFGRDQAILSSASQNLEAVSQVASQDFSADAAKLDTLYTSYDASLKGAQSSLLALPYVSQPKADFGASLLEPTQVGGGVSLLGAVSAGVSPSSLSTILPGINIPEAYKAVSDLQAQQKAMDTLKPWTTPEGINVEGAAASGHAADLLLVGIDPVSVKAAQEKFKAGYVAPATPTATAINPSLLGQAAPPALVKYYPEGIPSAIPEGLPSDEEYRAMMGTSEFLIYADAHPEDIRTHNLDKFTWADALGTAAFEHGESNLGLPEISGWEKTLRSMWTLAPLAPLATLGVIPAIGSFAIKAGAVATLATGGAALIAGSVVGPPKLDMETYSSLDPAAIGTSEAFNQLSPYLKTNGTYDTSKMLSELGPSHAAALMAQAGQKPVIPLEAYEKLTPEMQAFYTPTKSHSLAYEGGIAGIYGKGTEFLYSPVVDYLSSKGIVGGLASGMFQYAVPHTMVAELYPEKGALSALVLVPHFGPTAGHTALTWSEQSTLGKASGIGFAILPYAAGPIGLGVKAVSGVVSKVPVMGTVAGALSWAPGKVLGAVSSTGKAIKLESWAPWRGATELTQLAGAAGLGKVPGLAGFGMKAGWWHGNVVPLELRPPRVAVPETPIQKVLDQAYKQGKFAVEVPEGMWQYAEGPGWTLEPWEGMTLERLE